MVDLKDCAAESENVEVSELVLRRLESEKVDARFSPRCRSGDRLDRAVVRAALATWETMGGLIVRSLSTYAILCSSHSYHAAISFFRWVV